MRACRLHHDVGGDQRGPSTVCRSAPCGRPARRCTCPVHLEQDARRALETHLDHQDLVGIKLACDLAADAR